MLQHRAQLASLQRLALLYSAARPSELAFRGHLQQLAESEPRLRLDLRATRPGEEPWHGTLGRITGRDVAAALGEDFGEAAAASQVYLCGPPAMTDDLVEQLGPKGLGLKTDLKYEKWW